MGKYYLEEPSLKRKEEALELIDEYKENNSYMYGSSGLHKFYNNYEGWLDKIAKETEGNINKLPSNIYFTIREEDDRIVGILKLNHATNNKDGHVDFSTRPSEHNRFIPTIQIYLSLLKAKSLDVKRIRMDCLPKDVLNIESIYYLGGKREIGFSPNMIRYLIDVDKTIDRFKFTMSQYINSKSKTKR